MLWSASLCAQSTLGPYARLQSCTSEHLLSDGLPCWMNEWWIKELTNAHMCLERQKFPASDFQLGLCLLLLLPLCSALWPRAETPHVVLALAGFRLPLRLRLRQCRLSPEGVIPAAPKPHTRHLKYVLCHFGLSAFCVLPSTSACTLGNLRVLGSLCFSFPGRPRGSGAVSQAGWAKGAQAGGKCIWIHHSFAMWSGASCTTPVAHVRHVSPWCLKNSEMI